MHLRKRFLVTGGAGFFGSFLCERLPEEGCDIICCDNFYTGSKRNIVHLLWDAAWMGGLLPFNQPQKGPIPGALALGGADVHAIAETAQNP